MTRTIVHVNKAFNPEIGGVETVCQDYAEASLNQSKNVLVLTTSAKLGLWFRKETISGTPVLRCDHQFVILRQRISIFFVIFLVLYCLKRKTVVHAHDPFPLATFLFFLLRPSSLVVTYHSDILGPNWIKTIYDNLRLSVLKRASVVTTTSEKLAKTSDVLRKLDFQKIQVLPIYLKDAELYKKPVKRPVSLNSVIPDSPYLLMLGRMNYYKGLPLIRDALLLNNKTMRQNKLHLIIAGKQVDQFAKVTVKEIVQNSDNITVIDRYLTQQEKLYLLQNCHAFLFPSDKKTEAFGIVQLESLAAGRPVINLSLETGAPDLIIHGQTGFTVSPNDIQFFADLFANENDVFDTLKSFYSNIDAVPPSSISSAQGKIQLRKIYDSI